MSKLTSLVRRAPKRTSALIAMVAAAIVVPAIAFAYGPDRPTFTWENPADHITFNSITDNPVVGDERSFVHVKDDSASTYGKTVALQAGDTYDVEVYYHNDAASNLNLVAQNAMLRMEVPGTVADGGTANINGYISASNSAQPVVYDTATATNNTGAALSIAYIPNSATFTSLGAINGQTVPNTLFTTGANLGYNAQDGNLPGCNQYAGYVTFKFTVNQPNFTVQKFVREAGQTTWQSNITANVGDTIQYELAYKNTGTTDQDNVIANDYLPKGISYVNGSTELKNGQNPTPKTVSDNLVAANGINIGNYAPAAAGYLLFNAKVVDDGSLVCGANTLTNTGRMTTSSGYKEATATVTVNKACTPGTVTVCDTTTDQTVSGPASNFTDTTRYSTDLTKCTPALLPHTGPTTTVLGIAGLGAIVASLSYFITSRRALGKVKSL